jgi:RNA polymerase sigma factor (sigma-70 family)
MNQNELIPHLFRTEFRKIAAVLTKHFGIEHIEVAEDIASETFMAAMETWSYQGLPQNPRAWLYSVAKNKARNYLQRGKIYSDRVQQHITNAEFIKEEVDLSEQNVLDSQLKMLFAICHPAIPPESQIGLSLRILCGFGIEEIANAFLTNKETINKRLFRAREKLRQEKIRIELPSEAEIQSRLERVLTTLYLLYSEGYYSESNNTVLREELCAEAMRLTYQLIENQQTNQPAVHALFSLMCFHASRFESRIDDFGHPVLYADQDESKWNFELIARGAYHLKQASQGNSFTRYHLEAGIAYWHTQKADTKEKWENILQLYNKLLMMEYSPIAALNRTYALSKVHDKKTAIQEAEKLNLTSNQYYYTLLGELHTDIENGKAIQYFERALMLAKTESDKQVIESKLNQLINSGT